MKSVLGKTIGGISSLTRGTYNVLTLSRFRRSQSVTQNDARDETGDRELNSLDGHHEGGSLDRSGTASYTPPPHNHPSITQEDDILYRKNNVYLKCEIGAAVATSGGEIVPGGGCRDGSVSRAVRSLRSLHEAAAPSTPGHAQQQRDKVPGFLFIASRGSNYGSTLILNWASNSSIIKCSGSINSAIRTAGEASDSEMTASGSSERSQNERHSAANAVSHSSSAYSILSPPSPSHFSPVSPPTVVHTSDRGGGGAAEHKCVSIDLGDMEVIRIFYQTDDTGRKVSGEMVVSSKQTSFWVFHFPNGGLMDLIHLFSSWKYFNHHEHREAHQHTFSIFRPKLSLSQLHPGEGEIKSVLTEEMWQDLFEPDGRVTDSACVKKVVFFKGVSPSLRKEVWPFLLGVYRFDSNNREREATHLERCRKYWALDDKRGKIERGERGAETASEWATVSQQIERDVRRTDRSHPYYREDRGGSRHVRTLEHILLNYLLHNPDLRYCQGMTDLLAPLLASMEDDVDAFWCFEKLVEGTAYFKPASNPVSVDRQLQPLRLLVRQLLPWFYSYLESTENGLTLMFCHRWLLVCFKREFTEEDTLAVWEACWTNYETTSFHLFVCVAVMAIYGQRAVEKRMNINELMVFFNTLSLTMPRDLVLTQARGYLHQFATSPSVHCTLTSVMPPEFWRRPESPKLECGLCHGLHSSCESRDLQPYSMEALC